MICHEKFGEFICSPHSAEDVDPMHLDVESFGRIWVVIMEINSDIYGYLVGGLEHEFYFSIYWEVHHPN
jgi:hypothetical protein